MICQDLIPEKYVTVQYCFREELLRLPSWPMPSLPMKSIGDVQTENRSRNKIESEMNGS